MTNIIPTPWWGFFSRSSSPFSSNSQFLILKCHLTQLLLITSASFPFRYVLRSFPNMETQSVWDLLCFQLLFVSSKCDVRCFHQCERRLLGLFQYSFPFWLSRIWSIIIMNQLLVRNIWAICWKRGGEKEKTVAFSSSVVIHNVLSSIWQPDV